jgi:HEAT repeat protein
MMEYGHLPYLASWRRMKGGDIDAAFQKRLQDFPADLLKALENRESADYNAAVTGLAIYTGLARTHAASLREKDLSRAVSRALAPDTARIRKALGAGLQAKSSETRLMTALTLLSLDENDAKANEVLQAIAASADAKLLAKTAQMIGGACFTSPQAIGCPGRLLKHRDPEVREAAAGAIITMGPAARDLVPALIAFLETGDDARGGYSFAIGPPKSGNLALMALISLGEHAKPAVPAILARFPKANDEDRLAMLVCLACCGQDDAACLAAVRQMLKSEKAELKLAAACTLLRLVGGDGRATEIIKTALAEKATRELVLKTCARFEPPSREIAASLIPLLDDKQENVRILAMHALGAIGPHAAEAVPGLEKLLAKEENAMDHTFLSTRSAAEALAEIGGKEAAAALVRVAGSKVTGARHAMLSLPELADDLPPDTVAVLTRALEQKDGERRLVAAVSLSNLGDRARAARPALQRLLDDPEIGWVVDTALRRIPAPAQ